MDEFIDRADLLRREAASKIRMGGGLPVVSASALCLQNASLHRSGDHWVSPAYKRTWEFVQVPGKCVVCLDLVEAQIVATRTSSLLG